MRLLALDTASAQCSVALLLEGALLTRAVATAREHAQRLLPMVDELLAEAGVTLQSLDGIAFGRGPGTFTGVRIAAAVTQGLAAGTGLPVLPVSDLRVLAEQARESLPADAATGGALLACMDARMGEVYWGLYAHAEGPVREALDGERLSGPAALCEALAGGVHGAVRAAAGMGLGAYPAIAGSPALAGAKCLSAAEPHAGQLIRLAARDLADGSASWLDAAQAQPHYLRDQVIQAPPQRNPRL